MTDVLTRGSHEGALPAHGSAYAVMTECLRIQASARAQSRLARLFGASPLTPDARGWYRATLGELQIERMLGALPANWTVLRAADSADTLIIGPAGVFTLATPDHTGQRVWVEGDTLLVNGHRTDHIREARYLAARTTRHLSTGIDDPTDVTPVIAVVDPGSLSIKRRPEGLLVIASSQLTRTLIRRKRRLPDAAIAELEVRAELLGTWHVTPPLPEEHGPREARFARLRDAVDSAAHRRAGWVLGGVALAATVVAMAMSLAV